MFCLETVEVQNGILFHLQTNKVVTRSKKYVSTPNNTLHHVILQIITALKAPILFINVKLKMLFISPKHEQPHIISNTN